jgi:glycosyltransferase involved in cell wall biosynthesis
MPSQDLYARPVAKAARIPEDTADGASLAGPGGGRRVLLVAFFFPPSQGSSGLQRTLSFARDLRDHGWQPLVLTAHHRAYPRTDGKQLADIPADVPVARAFALDTARHFAVRGIHFRSLAVPDRWWPWYLGGLASGWRLIRRYQPDVIWSTAPIPTAHLIAQTLARLSGRPWVADIRDLMTEPDWPKNPVAWRISRWIERQALTRSERTVVVSPGQRGEYLRRFPALPQGRIAVIPNGFDEAAFRKAEASAPDHEHPDGRLHLVHSGLLYPRDRSPEPFLEALAALRGERPALTDGVAVTLRASGSEARYRQMIRELDLAGVVSLAPALSYHDALAEMLAADGLLLFQGRNCGTAIPAKLYEYIRARRPVLALTEPDGATGAALREVGYPHLAPLESAAAIGPVLAAFLEAVRQGEAFVPPAEVTAQFSRQRAGEQLAAILDRVVP